MVDHVHGDTVHLIDLDSRPALRPHVRLRQDPVRGGWVVLAPERILTPNEQAADVLRLCDGQRTVADIAAQLADTYDAEPDTIIADIVPVLQGLVDAGVLKP
jgi:pyrroloquinoline quinone biosynthesis protein D